MTPEGPLLSVVVTTYSGERLSDVAQLVDSLAAQTYGRIELVFVAENDPAMRDAVARFAGERGLATVALFNDGEPGASAARNLGIGRARGEIVAFLDDTTVAQPDWAAQIAKTFAEHPEAVGVAGLAEPLWQDPSLAWLPPELEWLVSCTGFLKATAVQPTAHGATVNVAYRREVFAEAGLFLTELGPKRTLYGRRPRWQEGSEDQEFSRRVVSAFGDRILLNPAVRVRRKVYAYQLTTSFIARRARATGWSRRMLRRLYGSQDRTLGRRQAGLLGRIVIGLLPRVLLRFLYRPATAWKQLRATVAAVVFVGVGYASFYFHRGDGRFSRPGYAIATTPEAGLPAGEARPE